MVIGACVVHQIVSAGGASYSLYTHSYLGYGQDAARARYNELLPTSTDPCFPKNYSKSQPSTDPYDGRDGVLGAGNYSQCTQKIETELFPPVVCTDAPCSFGGVHQPPIWGTDPSGAPSAFVMFENFFHSSKVTAINGG